MKKPALIGLFVIVTATIPSTVATANPACTTTSCFTEACENGRAAACVTMSDLEHGRPEALHWLAKGCRLRDRRSCDRLGHASPYGEELDVAGALAADETACSGAI